MLGVILAHTGLVAAPSTHAHTSLSSSQSYPAAQHHHGARARESVSPYGVYVDTR